MMILQGTVADDPAEPSFAIVMLFFLGPGMAIQVFWALNVAMR
jgi:hypothetical protein